MELQQLRGKVLKLANDWSIDSEIIKTAVDFNINECNGSCTKHEITIVLIGDIETEERLGKGWKVQVTTTYEPKC